MNQDIILLLILAVLRFNRACIFLSTSPTT